MIGEKIDAYPGMMKGGSQDRERRGGRGKMFEWLGNKEKFKVGKRRGGGKRCLTGWIIGRRSQDGKDAFLF